MAEDFIRKFKLISETIAVNAKRNNPLINPQFLKSALGRAKAPAPNAHAIKANILALREPGLRGPKYRVQQFFAKIKQMVYLKNMKKHLENLYILTKNMSVHSFFSFNTHILFF